MVDLMESGWLPVESEWNLVMIKLIVAKSYSKHNDV